MRAHPDEIDHYGVKAIGYDGWLMIESFGWGLPDLAAAPKVWRDLAGCAAAVCRDGGAHVHKSIDRRGFAVARHI